MTLATLTKKLILPSLIALLGVSSMPGQTTDPLSTQSSDSLSDNRIHVELMPYFMVSGMSGSVAIKNQSIPVNADAGDLLRHLQAAISQAGAMLSDDFSLEGSVCMAGCERPCTVAFQATAKATYLFGDIEDAADIGALVSFARLYRDRPDGLTRESERPRALGGKTLARIPAAIVSAERRLVALQ